MAPVRYCVLQDGSSIVLALEFMQSDLFKVLRAARRPLAESQVKRYMLMLLDAVEYDENNLFGGQKSKARYFGK